MGQVLTKSIAEEVGIDKYKVFNWIKNGRFPTLFAKERFFSKNLFRVDKITQDDIIKLLAIYRKERRFNDAVELTEQLHNK
jgi:hypothetical protein